MSHDNDEPTTTIINNNNEVESSPDQSCSSSSALANGISTLVKGLISDFDGKAEDVSLSQLKVSSSLDRLTGELDQLLEDAPLPFVMQNAAKLSNVRRRVSSLNLILKSIQRRLDNIDRVVSVGLPNDQQNAEGLK